MSVATSVPQPLVSVIMPTYNRAHLIESAIESVLTQSYDRLELIVIDNYSQDHTERVVTSIAARDPRVRYFKYANHGLVAASRNAGIEAATGEYLAFLDSDDSWLPDKVQKQVGFLERHPEVFLVYSKFLIRKGSAVVGVGPRVYRLVRGRVFERLFLSDNMIGSLTVMMRRGRSADDVYYFRTERELFAVEDYDLWLRMARTRTFDFINEPLAVYNIHDANMTSSVKLYFTKNVRLMKLYRGEVSRLLILKRYVFCFLPVTASIVYRRIAGLLSSWRHQQAVS